MNLWLKSEGDEALSRHILEWGGGAKPSTSGLSKHQRVQSNSTEAAYKIKIKIKKISKMADGRGVGSSAPACLPGVRLPSALLRATQALSPTLPATRVLSNSSQVLLVAHPSKINTPIA